MALSFIFTHSLQAQTKPFPNELKGFELYGRGRIAVLKLAVSSKEDVARVFGSDCIKKCDYDDKWFVNISYIGDLGRSIIIGDNMRDLIPKPQFAGKIESIVFTPKGRIKFKKSKFTREFTRRATEGISERIKGNLFFDYYFDEYGLFYFIFKRFERAANLEFNSEITAAPENIPWKKGDLTSILYAVTKEQEEQIWIEK